MSASCHGVSSWKHKFPAGQTPGSAFKSFFKWNDGSGNGLITAGSWEQNPEQLLCLAQGWEMGFSGLRILSSPQEVWEHSASWGCWAQHHTPCISAWTSCWWKKWDYPFVKREDKDVTGFGVKLWANQRLVLPGWGCSAGAVSGSRKEFWFLWAAKWAAWLQIKPIYSDNTQQQWVEVFWFPITQPFSTSGPWQQFLFSNWQFSAGVCRLRAHHITMAMKVGGFILSLPPLWVF